VLFHEMEDAVTETRHVTNVRRGVPTYLRTDVIYFKRHA